ncbi:MAG: NAD(P)H-binding protein, partial [Candidatus Omnitrophota bacterium]
MKTQPVLVTGATGYVGGRLVPRLLAAGYRIRALGRSPAKLRSRPWGGHPLLELAQGDVLDEASLHRAAQGCWAAFYLVHSMTAAARDFAEVDRRAASNLARAAAVAGLDRI